MPRKFRVPAGTAYPASLADFRLARQRKPHKRVTANQTKTVDAPYEEIVSSWLVNGVTEVKHGVSER